MARLLVTQVFPFLLPLRQKQKKLCFYHKMRTDGNKYATKKHATFSYVVYESKSLLINKDSGQDIKYQYNKVHNLKLATMTMNGVVIEPQEYFSFWWLVKDAQKQESFKPGLNLIRGKLSEVEGGGLCQLSVVLYELFLHTFLTTIERTGHDSLSIYNESTKTHAMDATINEGWLDLKMKNETNDRYQLVFEFDDDYLYAKILMDKKPDYKISVYNQFSYYYYDNQQVFLKSSVDCLIEHPLQNTVVSKHLYTDTTRIDFDISLIKDTIESGVRT